MRNYALHTGPYSQQPRPPDKYIGYLAHWVEKVFSGKSVCKITPVDPTDL